MVFSCFASITGGRVGEIVNQEAKLCKKNESLPLSRNDDKIEKFCDTYKGFIDVTTAYEEFNARWEQQKKDAGASLKDKRRFPLLINSLAKSFYGDLWMAFFCKLIWGVLLIFSIQFFVFGILDYIKLKKKDLATEDDEVHALYLCGGFFFNMFVLSVGIQQMGMYSSILGSEVKAALTTAIYKKMIIRDPYGSKADVVSLVAKDVEKIAEACTSLQYLWSGIFETVAVFCVVIYSMGFIVILPGLGLMCVFLPLQYILGLFVAYRKKSLVTVSKERISLMEEILRGIKLIKIYGWEQSFFTRVSEVREEERKMSEKINRIKSLILGLTFSLPPMLSMVIFGTQEATGKIESVVIFTTLSFFNTLRVPFSKLPKSLRDVLDSLHCLERIQDFLLEPELAVAADSKKAAKGSHKGIVFQNVSLSYGKEGKILLKDINLNIAQGSLMMVAGPVAGGKSNLLKSVLGDMTIRSGSCFVSPSKAYVPQTPWTALGTVRDNILFGKPYDEVFYKKVIYACALERDLEIMADADMTWIGERGGNLSGGQKQRIALARAAYSRAEVYVLDSPLSAVDMYTCQHIFKFCIQELMIGGGGTVVLATHQTELFSMSDHLVVMKEGNMAYNAKYSYEGIKHLFPNFAGEAEAGESKDEEEKSAKPSSIPSKKKEDVKKKYPSTAAKTKPKAVAAKEDKGSIYVWYMHRLGAFLFALATLIFIIGQICRVYSDAWISTWSKRKFAPNKTQDVFYAGMYAVTVHVFIVVAFLRAYVWFWVGGRGANIIHKLTFGAALKAPMHFYHVTPIGKLLTFFSKDVETIDDMLVDNTLMFQIFFWILILALGVVTYNLTLFLAIVGAILVIFAYVLRTFILTSVPLKKVSSEAVSQVIAHTAETLSGLAVVRAFRMQGRFLNENLNYQSRSTVTCYALANLSLWLAFRMDIVGSLLVLGCCLLAVLKDNLDPADAGLIVSNSFQILLFFSIMCRTMGEVHDNMAAVEEARIMAELEAEQEPDEELDVPGQWPSKGEITFEDVVMPYLPGKPPVLRGISFTIREGEKIGVVGRTGAGKSSLIVALYRLAEITEGRIHVDDIDCSQISLNKLRSSMAIIPQEPVMFSGTLRTNLDPFNNYTDEELIDVLEKCLLESTLDNEDGLDAKVELMGSNFSLGTQQLICLARAMLNPSRVLLLDEATAALDSDTNAAVSQVLQAHFSDRTIFTIAHRLDTIIDSDRILVMDAGVIAEFERPDILLDDPTSIFRELCMNTGKAQFEVLAAKARANAAIRYG